MKTLVTTARIFAVAAVAIVSIIAPTVVRTKQVTAKTNLYPTESVTAKVDQLFMQWNNSDTPGCSLGVSGNGALLYERGYGMANLELGVPITPASVFHVASVSKQFTAMSILLLTQRGQLSLDDELRKYVPEWADHRNGVTIRHLLSHTSGVRDGFTLREFSAASDDVFDNDVMVKILARTRALNFTPGTEFQYNNSAYALLASIVSRVSGQSLRAFTEANIFKPLGMTHTHFHDDPTVIVPNFASGYHQDADGLHVALHSYLNHIVGNTGLFTTARDLLLWEQNFADARVGGKAVIAAMQTPVIPTGWSDKSFYGLGLEIGDYRGLQTIGHGGGDPGYRAYLVRYPDQGLAVAVLCNLDDIDPATVAHGVADIYLSDAFATPSTSSATATPPRVSLSAEQLASKAGLYFDPLSESVGRMFVRNGKLMAREGAGDGESVELTPVSENRFVVLGTPIVAEFVPAGPVRPQEVRVTGAGPKPIVSKKLDAFAPSRAQLRAYAGWYTSSEVEGRYTLAAHDSRLVIQIPGRTDITLQPIFPDGFAGAVVGVVKFLRDAQRIVTGFTVNTSGVRGMRFDRVKK